MTAQNNDEHYKYQHLPYSNLSGELKKNLDPANAFFEDLTHLTWKYEDGLPVAVTSNYPEAIYQAYLDTIDSIKYLSKFVNQDTPKESPSYKELMYKRIENDILKRWIYHYHGAVKQLKLPALIPEIKDQPSQEQPTEKPDNISLIKNLFNDHIETIKKINRVDNKKLDMFIKNPVNSWSQITFSFDGQNILINKKPFSIKQIGFPELPKNNPGGSTAGLFIKILTGGKRYGDPTERKTVTKINKILKSVTGLADNPITGSGNNYILKFKVDNKAIDKLKDDYKNHPYDDGKSTDPND